MWREVAGKGSAGEVFHGPWRRRDLGSRRGVRFRSEMNAVHNVVAGEAGRHSLATWNCERNASKERCDSNTAGSMKASLDVERAIVYRRESVSIKSDLESNVERIFSYQTKGPSWCNLSARPC